MSLEGSPASTSVTVDPKSANGENIAFAVYDAPMDYEGSGNSTDITIRAQVGPTFFVEKTIKLYRPPVVLVHGVWSDRTSMQALDSYLRSRGFNQFCDDCLVDYSADNAGSFDPTTGSTPINSLANTALNAIISYHRHRIAATQVDVVGHSMGGLVARARIKYQGRQYYRLPNFLKGEFHKIITVGSPHLGTPLADWLLAHKCEQMRKLGISYRIEDFFQQRLHKRLGDAVYGFQTSSSSIQHIGETNVWSRAIIGKAPATSDTEDNLNEVPRLSGHSDTTIDGLLDRNGNHDTLVSTTSQRGGLSTTQTQQVDGVVHANAELVHSDVSEMASADIWSNIEDALKDPVGSSSFGKFPSFSPSGTPLQPKPCPATSDVTALLVSSATVTMNPSRGTLVRPGDTIQIDLNVAGGNPVEGALVAIGGQLHNLVGSGPFTLSYRVPSDRAGKIDIFADTYGSGFENYSASTYVVANAEATASVVEVFPKNLVLQAIGDSYQIRIAGQLSDGTPIDLTPGTAGTSYSLQSSTNKVAAISPDGLVEAHGLGDDTILVTYSGINYTVNLTVGDSTKPRLTAASISGKKLILTGEGFDDGAKILLEGNQQKSANDDENPTTTLIGKKAGKLIAPGQTVVLMVRNSDGSLSNGFSFTRP